MTSKNYNLFLIDGEVTGRIKCTLFNWTGIAYKIPRSKLNNSKYRQDLKQSGVYFLFGKNDDDNKEEVYIGQAGIRKNGEGVLYRVLEHLNKDEIYFNEVVILTTQNNSFGPTEISYLENKFTNMAKQINRYNVKNGNDPNPGHVTEEKESELEDFIEYSKMVLGVLGYKIFVPLVKNENNIDNENKDLENNEELTLYISQKIKNTDKIFEAKCIRTDEGFVVLEGSMIKEKSDKSIRKNIKALREKLIQNNTIINGILQQDYLFDSPSYAAQFVLGSNSNGKKAWKTKDSLTLKDLEEKEII